MSHLSEAFKRAAHHQKEEDKILFPSRMQIKYLKTYLCAMEEEIYTIQNLFDMAEQRIIEPKQAQKLIDWQLDQLKRNMRHVESFLEPIEE